MTPKKSNKIKQTETGEVLLSLSASAEMKILRATSYKWMEILHPTSGFTHPPLGAVFCLKAARDKKKLACGFL